MSKLVYQEPQDHFVQVSICSLNSFLSLNPFFVDITNANKQKIEKILNHSTDSEFILMPEYTYTPELENLYQQYCNDHNSIIIGGSGLEQNGQQFYAYAPVFMPGTVPLKVYKKNITNPEIIYSEGRIVNYPGDVQRQIRVHRGDNEMVFSVYVCNDFLVENKSERSDIVFVPQYEPSPQQYMFEADRIAKGMTCFVVGANNADNNQRSIGCAVLNNHLIKAMAARGWRQKEYNENAGGPLVFHHTIIYDVQDEKMLKLRLNIGRPFSFPYDYNLVAHQPVIIPMPDIPIP